MPRSGVLHSFTTPEEVMDAVKKGDIKYYQFCAELAILAALSYINNECGAAIGLDGNSFVKGHLTPVLTTRAQNTGVEYKSLLKQFQRDRKAYRTAMNNKGPSPTASPNADVAAPGTAFSRSAVASSTGGTYSDTMASELSNQEQASNQRIVTDSNVATSLPVALADDEVVMTGTGEAEEEDQPDTRRSKRIRNRQ
ncbi:hypothetical protein CLAFUW4_02443 [Fulvia fulva]|nr:hypothetical protein CLAFUR4_02438 [Fulvia fulva]KAK4632464.1 hypothetical protein CLAFUR0_02442 [Fulvia fulva]WPV11242.1 hypothetical protein CLAFUW4_02443 [Fulvia fulva]WPV26505.1 hypothetical protein CLAFUW7_02443 [Fulvia fulva]